MFWLSRFGRIDIFAVSSTCTVEKCHTATTNFQIVAMCRDITDFRVINSVEVAFRY